MPSDDELMNMFQSFTPSVDIDGETFNFAGF